MEDLAGERGPGGALAGAAGGRARGARVRARRSTRMLGAGLEKKTPIYDAAIVLDPLTEGFAKGEGASSSRRRFIVCKIAQPRFVAAFSRRQYVLVIFKIMNIDARVPSPAFREKTDLNGNGATRPYYAQ